MQAQPLLKSKLDLPLRNALSRSTCKFYMALYILANETIDKEQKQ